MRRLPGWLGWVLTFAVVGIWDLHPRTETMSSAFAPTEGRHGRPVYLAIWCFLTLHLMRILPTKYDPLRRLPALNRKETHR